MAIGTSTGQTYDDEGQYHASLWDPDTYAPSEDSSKTGLTSTALKASTLPDISDVPEHDWVDNLIKSSASGFKDFVTTPGDVMSGNKPVSPETAAMMATHMMGAPALVAERAAAGEFGSFAGIRSKSLDRGALQLAQDAEAQGIHPDQIWQQTGFFRGADTRWRTEIPDTNATINDKGFNKTLLSGGDNVPSWTNVGGNEDQLLYTVKDSPKDIFGKTIESQAIRLPDVLDHPDLYEAYPQLAKTKIQPLPQHLVDQGVKGQMSSSTNTMYLAPDLHPEFIRSVLLHEAQHQIQAIEGFARGGGQNEFLDPTLNAAQKMYDDELAKGADPNSERMKAARKILNDERQRAFDNYQNLAGEVEARNVQKRMDMDDFDRKYMSPIFTEDRKRNQQILLNQHESVNRLK